MWVRATLLSALLLAGRRAGASPLMVEFEDVNTRTLTERVDKTTTLAGQTVAQTESTVMSSDGSYSTTGQRTLDLQYVTAIQRSSAWSDIKKRSTVAVSGGGGGGGGSVLNESPETLSDADLAELRRLCHDGLKCMAVEQLYVIDTVKKQIVGGDASGTIATVRTVMTKITKVFSEYATQYHTDTYEYPEVIESSDPSVMYESVTDIIEDNRELCGVTDDDDGTGAVALLLATLGAGGPAADGRPNDDAAPGFVNLGTINHYNVNEGTVNNVGVTCGCNGAGKDRGVVIDLESEVVADRPGDGQSSSSSSSSLQMPGTVHDMTVNNTNNGTYNNSVVRGNENAGTVNVGSGNERPHNNDTYNDFSVNSHNRTVNAQEFNKFLNYLDNSFTSVLNELSRPAA